jgi:hypothetical protein
MQQCPEYEVVEGRYRGSWAVMRTGPRGGRTHVVTYFARPTFPTSEKAARDLAATLNEFSWREVR